MNRRWISPTWLLPPSIGVNNPKHCRWRTFSTSEICCLLYPTRTESQLPAAAVGHVMWSEISFLSAKVELLTWPVPVLCNSSTRTHVISLRGDEGMKGRRTQRCHLPIFTRRCRDWQAASEVSSFTPILRQDAAPHDNAVDWSYFFFFFQENVFFFKKEHKLFYNT